MSYKISCVKRINGGSAPQTVKLGYAPFLIANTGNDTLYFCAEKHGPATAQNGFPLAAGASIKRVLNIDALSISAGGSAAILVLE